MWIKHNNALYNTNDIRKIEARRTKLWAVFMDGTEEIIGEFRATKECQDICNNISRALLFEIDNHPGILIKDTNIKRGSKK